MGSDVDWQHGAEHMWENHQVTVEQASEALADPSAKFYNPDPKSKSGTSARLIGYSPDAEAVLVVILVARDDKPGAWWGANGWRANSTDRRIYNEQFEEQGGSDE